MKKTRSPKQIAAMEYGKNAYRIKGFQAMLIVICKDTGVFYPYLEEEITGITDILNHANRIKAKKAGLVLKDK